MAEISLYLTETDELPIVNNIGLITLKESMKLFLLATPTLLALILLSPPAGRHPASHVESLAYPIVARNGNIQGTVEVQVTIDGDGNVANASAISGHPLLRKAALENIRRWKFEPATPDDGILKIMYVFRLDSPETYYEPQTLNLFDFPSRVEIVSRLPQPQP